MSRPDGAAMPASAIAQLRDIAQRLARLAPDYQRPQRYYDRRDTLVDELDQLCGACR